MQVHAWSLQQIETLPLPGSSAVICMADSQGQLATIRDTANVAARLDLIFDDTTEKFTGLRPPSSDDAHRILQFVMTHQHVPHLMIQCQVGIGRSQAVAAALTRIGGANPKSILSRGPYNRRLYRELLTAAGLTVEAEPLVSIAVRIKYAPDRLRLFVLSMQRQRYENWELVAVTDGPNSGAVRMVAEINDPRIRLIETEKRLGRWGHPYRQRGLDVCRGDFIGMSNDDNYYVPGYLEQMLQALESADLAMCQALHSYSAWAVVPAGTDLGCWIARAHLVRKAPWPGNEFTSDRDHLQALVELASGRVAVVERPLFVHN